MVRFADEKTANFIDVFQSFPCLWEVTSKDYHRREMRQAAMQNITASLHQEGEVVMTSECFKIRSGELPYLFIAHAFIHTTKVSPNIYGRRRNFVLACKASIALTTATSSSESISTPLHPVHRRIR